MTPSFTHHDPGTPESSWARALPTSLPALPVPGSGDRVVVVAAHPDDESLGAGGLIAAAARSGADVCVLIATDGEASHPHSPTHSPDRLAEIRQVEVRSALANLSSHVDLRLLGLGDGRLTERKDELRDQIKAVLDDATHLVSTWTRDGHPDHEACGAACAGLVATTPGLQHWQYPIWAWHWATPSFTDELWHGCRRLDLPAEHRVAKRAALGCYASQHNALSSAPGDEVLLAPSFLAHFDRSFETFLVTPPTAPAAAADYFDRLYADTSDPWGLADRFYERRKRDLVLAALPRARFGRCFEPGCATGELTALLALRCDSVVAWDGAPAAVAATQARLAESNVSAVVSRVPDAWPHGEFDLIVLSEIGYYCPDLELLISRVRASLTDPGVVVACHWRRPAPDHPHTGDAVHDALQHGLGLHRSVHHEEADFLLDVWSTQPASVAQLEGLLN